MNELMQTPIWFEELKSKGFPFKMDRPPNADPNKIVFSEYVTEQDLIGACGGADSVSLMPRGSGWIASLARDSISAEGQDRQEALAHLWLILNKK